MRDLNLGPETRDLIAKFRKADESLLEIASEMANMLDRWMAVAWCWVDAAPARICGGPHVKVQYANGITITGKDPKPVVIIEPTAHVGETFPDVAYTILKLSLQARSRARARLPQRSAHLPHLSAQGRGQSQARALRLRVRLHANGPWHRDRA